jgi:hypothetical protein
MSSSSGTKPDEPEGWSYRQQQLKRKVGAITTEKNKSDGGLGIFAYPPDDLNQKSITNWTGPPDGIKSASSRSGEKQTTALEAKQW